MAITKKAAANTTAVTKKEEKKATATTAVTAAKPEAKTATAKTAVAKTTETKTAAPKAAAKKPAVKKTAPKKPAVKKTTKATASKVEVFVEFGGVQVSIDEVVENVKKTTGNSAKAYKIYLKPEESKAYFVADDSESEMDVFFC